MNYWEKADYFTPGLCRIMARHPRGLPLTSQEIADNAASIVGYELTWYEVHLISLLDNWSKVSTAKMRAFLLGCRIDFDDPACMDRINKYLKASTFNKRSRFKYLMNSPEWEPVFKPILKKLSQRI